MKQKSCCVRSYVGSLTDRSECASSRVALTTQPTTGKGHLYPSIGLIFIQRFNKIHQSIISTNKPFKSEMSEKCMENISQHRNVTLEDDHYWCCCSALNNIFYDHVCKYNVKEEKKLVTQQQKNIFFVFVFDPHLFVLTSGLLWFPCVYYPSFLALFSSLAPATTPTGSPCK